MAEYIERDAAKDELLSWAVCIKHPEHLMKEDAMHILDSIPAADVVPKEYHERCLEIEIQKRMAIEPKHGHWVGLEYDGYADENPVYDLWECSECGNEELGEDVPETHPFCSWCGARMDGDIDV